MTPLTPETLREFYPSKGPTPLRGFTVLYQLELDACADAWAADIAKRETLERTVEKAGVDWKQWGKLLVKAEAHIEALERDLRWVMDFAKGQEPWDDDGDAAKFNQIEAALRGATRPNATSETPESLKN